MMRTIYLLPLAVSVLLGCSKTPVAKWTDKIQPFVDSDLRNLKQEEVAQLMQLLPPRVRVGVGHEDAPPHHGKPWYICRSSTSMDDPRFVLFVGLPIFMMPGTSGAGIHFLDRNGKELSASLFSTGWRIDLTSIKSYNSAKMGVPVIEVSVKPVEMGVDISREFYAIAEDRVVLLRLEDARGELVRNVYYATNHTIGPDVPSRKAEEWETLLISDSNWETLEALVWLGGVHLEVPSAWRSSARETREASELAQAVYQRKGVQARLKRLLKSDHPWVADAAEAAREFKLERMD